MSMPEHSGGIRRPSSEPTLNCPHVIEARKDIIRDSRRLQIGFYGRFLSREAKGGGHQRDYFSHATRHIEVSGGCPQIFLSLCPAFSAQIPGIEALPTG